MEPYLLDVCSAIPVSGSDLLKYFRATHFLKFQPFLSVVLNYSNTWEQLTNWDVCSALLISGSEVVNTREQLTSWMQCWTFLLVVLICSKNWEWTHRLDAWPVSSVAQTLTGKHWRETHILEQTSCQWFWSFKYWRTNSLSEYMQVILISVSKILKPWSVNSLSGCMFSHPC